MAVLSCSCLAGTRTCVWHSLLNKCIFAFTWQKTTHSILLRILEIFLKVNGQHKFLPRLHQLELSSLMYSDCAHTIIWIVFLVFFCKNTIVNVIIAQHNVLILGQVGSISLCVFVLIVARHVSRQIGQDMARTSDISSNASSVLLVAEEDVSGQILNHCVPSERIYGYWFLGLFCENLLTLLTVCILTIFYSFCH